MEHQNFPWWKTTQAIVAINSSYSVTICDHLLCILNVQDETGAVTEVFRYSFVCGNMTIFDQVVISSFSTTSWFQLLSFFICRLLSLVIVLKTRCRAIRFRIATIKITVDKNSYDLKNY